MISPSDTQYELYASGHHDKTPMVLVHTAGTSRAGPQRKRVYRYYDSESKCNRSVVLTLMQPQVHATYRGRFWVVDRHNSLALGPDGTHRAIRVKTWHRRLFLGLVSITLVNALLAYNKT